MFLVAGVLIRLYCRCALEEISPEWFQEFSPSAYYPMEGLLAEEDFEFINRQPGFDPALYRKLRRERLQIFRQYLYRLIRDFNRLHAIARALLARGGEDRSEQLTRLIALKWQFTGSVIRAELRYRLCWVGFQSLPVRGLIANLEQAATQVELLKAHQAV